MMKTSEKSPHFFESLAVELEPKRESDSLGQFLLKWFICAALFTLVSLYLMPFRFDLTEQLSNPLFYALSLFWFMSSLFLAILVYQSSVPGTLKWLRPLWAFAPLVLILVLAFLRSPIHELSSETAREMDLYRGRCGPIIAFTGLLGTGLFYFWVYRKGRPQDPRFTAIAVALASGSLASFIMELICPYENAMHLVIWHFAPLAVLTALLASIVRKI